MLKGRQVSIIGAGIAGLSLAVALARRGARVSVLERSSTVSTSGAGIQITPNGFVVLKALGLGDALLSMGLQAQAVELRDHRAGRRILRIDLTKQRSGQPFVLVHRARLISLLEGAAHRAGVALTYGIVADPGSMAGQLVIGADGINSKTRLFLNGSGEPFFTGQVAWRAVVADDAVPEAHVYLGPGRHLVTYPIGAGFRNIIAVEGRRSWEVAEWDQIDDPTNLRAAFASFEPEVRHWLDQVNDVRLWGLFRYEVAGRWHDGRIAILGDAAHPTLPFLAQGANLALEDAWVLAHCLDRSPQDEALSEYQRLRYRRAVRVTATATANARNFHLGSPLVRRIAHTALGIGGTLAPRMALRRLEWLYDFDVTCS